MVHVLIIVINVLICDFYCHDVKCVPISESMKTSIFFLHIYVDLKTSETSDTLSPLIPGATYTATLASRIQAGGDDLDGNTANSLFFITCEYIQRH